MSNVIEKLRNDYADQLEKTVQELKSTEAHADFLKNKREQLKGAIYALDTASQNLADENKAAKTVQSLSAKEQVPQDLPKAAEEVKEAGER